MVFLVLLASLAEVLELLSQLFLVRYFVAIIGILAAIALPAYQDYTARAKVAQALNEIGPVKTSVIAFQQQHQMLPDSNIMLGINEPYVFGSGHKLIVSSDGITVVFADESNVLNGKTIIFYPEFNQDMVSWDCSAGDLPTRHRPVECR